MFIIVGIKTKMKHYEKVSEAFFYSCKQHCKGREGCKCVLLYLWPVRVCLDRLESRW